MPKLALPSTLDGRVEPLPKFAYQLVLRRIFQRWAWPPGSLERLPPAPYERRALVAVLDDAAVFAMPRAAPVAHISLRRGGAGRVAENAVQPKVRTASRRPKDSSVINTHQRRLLVWCWRKPHQASVRPAIAERCSQYKLIGKP